MKLEKRRGRQAGAADGVMAGLAQGAEEGPSPETPTLGAGAAPEPLPGEQPWRLERLMAERRRAVPPPPPRRHGDGAGRG